MEKMHILIKLLSVFIYVFSLTFLWPLFWSIILNDGQWHCFLLTILICIGVATILFMLVRRKKIRTIHRREGLAFVGGVWFIGALLGAIPFVLSDTFPSYIDAVFETMSGFTTTGASVLKPADFDVIPPSIMMWRCFTQWLGGMGIVVLFVAVLPLLGRSGKHLMRFEMPGPIYEDLRPRVAQTAGILWIIYSAISIVLTIILLVEGMDVFEAICHMFTTMATGGFSTRPESIMYYESIPIESTLIVFMLLVGTNFSLYFRLLRKEPLALVKDFEWRIYISIFFLATGLISLILFFNDYYSSWWDSFRFSAFQTASIMTTTGFVTGDFDQWPSGAKVILVTLMFIGACAGSTGGGIKVIRLIVMIKSAFLAIRKVVKPQTVAKVKIGGHVFSDDELMENMVFFFLWISLFVVGTLLLAILSPSMSGSMDIITQASAVIACLNNVGPGLSGVGPMENYSNLSDGAKVILTLMMVFGRLEIYAVITLFLPRIWKME